MTGKSQAVLWLGLLLILIRVVTTGQWKQLYNLAVTSTSPVLGPISGISSAINSKPTTGSIPKLPNPKPGGN